MASARELFATSEGFFFAVLAIMDEHLKALTTTYNDFKKNGGVELYSK